MPNEFLNETWQQALPEALAKVGVEGILFYEPTRRVGALAAARAVRQVARITYYGANDKMLERIGRSPNFAHLSELDFQDVHLTDAGLRAFAKNTSMTRLRDLTLSTSTYRGSAKARFTSAGVLALLNSARLPLLDSLEINGPSPAKFDYKRFFANQGLTRLTKLRLDIQVPMATVLASPHLANLRNLHLDITKMTDSDTDALLASPTFAKLTSLWLGVPTGVSVQSKRKLSARFKD